MLRVGQKLQQERLAQDLTLEEVAKATKIRVSFLTAIEKGDYQKLPSGSYAYGFVQNYAEYLQLPKRETLALFRREYDASKAFKVLPEGLTQKKDIPLHALKIKRPLLIGLIVVIALAGYLLYQYRTSLINPTLDVSLPKEKSIFSTTSVKITGKTDPNVAVYVNNQLAASQPDGTFQKVITLFPGKSTITIRALNRFNKETRVERHIEIKPNS